MLVDMPTVAQSTRKNKVPPQMISDSLRSLLNINNSYDMSWRHLWLGQKVFHYPHFAAELPGSEGQGTPIGVQSKVSNPVHRQSELLGFSARRRNFHEFKRLLLEVSSGCLNEQNLLIARRMRKRRPITPTWRRPPVRGTISGGFQ